LKLVPRLLKQNDHVMAFHKPSGMAMHRSDMVRDAYTFYDFLNESFEIPPLIIHRIDKPASGIVLAACGSGAASVLGKLFRESRVKKTYLIVVRGYTDKEGAIDIALEKKESGEMQEALTCYRTLEKIELPLPSRRFNTSRFSLVEVKPETGKFHQIRRHFARIGHPVLGDSSHGDTAYNGMLREQSGLSRLYLHACEISFKDPETEELFHLTDSVPEDMEFLKNNFVKLTKY